MTQVLVLSGPNHNFEASASIINEFLRAEDDLSVTFTDDKDILTSADLDKMDVCVFGTGFTKTTRQEDGTVIREDDLTPAQDDGLHQFVSAGKGLVGIHGTAWWIGGRAVDLIGGHANWHPPGSTFTVQITDPKHAVTKGLGDFEVSDEIYISAHEPHLHILATAEWHGKARPMVWVKQYGQGRVFYTTLGHGPDTFTRPGMQSLLTQGVRWAAG